MALRGREPGVVPGVSGRWEGLIGGLLRGHRRRTPPHGLNCEHDGLEMSRGLRASRAVVVASFDPGSCLGGSHSPDRLCTIDGALDGVLVSRKSSWKKFLLPCVVLVEMRLNFAPR